MQHEISRHMRDHLTEEPCAFRARREAMDREAV